MTPSTLLLLLLALFTASGSVAVTQDADATPLFTGDGVRSLATEPDGGSLVDDAALQQILARALQDEQPDAAYVLAMLKFYGRRVDRDVAGAVRLLARLAQRHGQRDAQFTLGVLFTSGAEGLPRDDRRGAAYLAASAASGHADAKWVLATLYTDGRGVPRDPARALALLTDAVGHEEEEENSQVNPRALFLLGVMYEYGHGGAPQDAARAARLYQRASDARVREATYFLALLHASGRGVRKNSALALRLLTRAADAGHAPALLRLGEVHADGESGVAVDYAAALGFFERAAARGSATDSDAHVAALARQRAAELQLVLSLAETRVREQEAALGVPLLRVQVATIAGR